MVVVVHIVVHEFSPLNLTWRMSLNLCTVRKLGSGSTMLCTAREGTCEHRALWERTVCAVLSSR
eukprot:9105979-Karenia_brevis.AAC.1